MDYYILTPATLSEIEEFMRFGLTVNKQLKRRYTNPSEFNRICNILLKDQYSFIAVSFDDNERFRWISSKDKLTDMYLFAKFLLDKRLSIF